MDPRKTTEDLKFAIKEMTHDHVQSMEVRLNERLEAIEDTINGLVAAYGIVGRLPHRRPVVGDDPLDRPDGESGRH